MEFDKPHSRHHLVRSLHACGIVSITIVRTCALCADVVAHRGQPFTATGVIYVLHNISCQELIPPGSVRALLYRVLKSLLQPYHRDEEQQEFAIILLLYPCYNSIGTTARALRRRPADQTFHYSTRPHPRHDATRRKYFCVHVIEISPKKTVATTIRKQPHKRPQITLNYTHEGGHDWSLLLLVEWRWAY